MKNGLRTVTNICCTMYFTIGDIIHCYIRKTNCKGLTQTEYKWIQDSSFTIYTQNSQNWDFQNREFWKNIEEKKIKKTKKNRSHVYL